MRLIGLQIARLLGQCSAWAGRLSPYVCLVLESTPLPLVANPARPGSSAKRPNGEIAMANWLQTAFSSTRAQVLGCWPPPCWLPLSPAA